jgi:membrane protein YdbS with pleckstrin-like domain
MLEDQDTAPSPEDPAVSLPPIADGVEHELHRSYVVLQRRIAWIPVGILAVGLAIAVLVLLVIDAVPGWVKLLVPGGGSVLLVAFASFLQVWPGVEHRHWRYRVSDLGLEIRHGVLWRKTVTVPRSRVQHTDVSQGPFERRLGLAKLHMFTAGTEHAQVELPGLGHDTALRIRDHLMLGSEDDAV